MLSAEIAFTGVLSNKNGKTERRGSVLKAMVSSCSIRAVARLVHAVFF